MQYLQRKTKVVARLGGECRILNLEEIQPRSVSAVAFDLDGEA